MKNLLLLLLLVKKVQCICCLKLLEFTERKRTLYYATWIFSVNQEGYDKFISKYFNFILKHNLSLAEVLAVYKGDIGTFIEIQSLKLLYKIIKGGNK